MGQREAEGHVWAAMEGQVQDSIRRGHTQQLPPSSHEVGWKQAAPLGSTSQGLG